MDLLRGTLWKVMDNILREGHGSNQTHPTPIPRPGATEVHRTGAGTEREHHVQHITQHLRSALQPDCTGANPVSTECSPVTISHRVRRLQNSPELLFPLLGNRNLPYKVVVRMK